MSGFIFMAAALFAAALVILPMKETGRKGKSEGNNISH
jgi:hypothetical protein